MAISTSHAIVTLAGHGLGASMGLTEPLWDLNEQSVSQSATVPPAAAGVTAILQGEPTLLCVLEGFRGRPPLSPSPWPRLPAQNPQHPNNTRCFWELQTYNSY